MLTALAVLLWTATGGASSAFGLGVLEVESLGFLRSSQDRGSSSLTLSAGPKVSADGNRFATAVDARIHLFADEPSSFTIEAYEAYVATPSRLSRLHQVTLGRRIYDWSRADRAWDLALFNPRFTWDPLKPETVGLAGVFYSYESARWRLLAYASPVAVPERGSPVTSEDGRLKAPGPYWIPPAEKLELDGGKYADIRYRIQYPPLDELLLRPSAAVSLRYGSEKGVWASASYGVLPVHVPELAVEGSLDAGDMAFNAVIHPRLYSRHLLTTEAGYRAGPWTIWASLSGDSPIRTEAPADWITLPAGPALIASWGGEFAWNEGLRLSASFLSVHENRGPTPPEAADFETSSRFNYRRAWKIGGKWRGASPLSYDVNWTYDGEHSSNLVSVDLNYFSGRSVSKWSFGLGADFIATSTGDGWIGQYQGDDRFRGRLSYAF